MNNPTEFEILRAKKSFSFFRKLIGRKEIAIHDFVIRKLLSGNKHLLLVAHRGSGKTILVSVDFVLWLVFSKQFGKKLTIGVLSHSLAQSTLIVEEIHNVIRDFAWLREELKPKYTHEDQQKWNASRITTKFGHRIFCVPFGGAVRGKSFDWCIEDDCLKPETSNIKYAIETFWGDVYPTTRNFGKHLVVNTPMFVDDLVADLKQPSKSDAFDVFEIPAFVDNDSAKGPSVPELYSTADLLKIKQAMPRHQWLREFELKPTSSGDMLFAPELLKRQTVVEMPVVDAADYFGFLDVAFSAGGDDAAICVCAKANGKKFIVYSETRNGPTDTELGNWVSSLNNQFHFAKFFVEANGPGQGIAKRFVEDPPFASFCEAFTTNHRNKELVFGSLQVELENNVILIPDNDRLFQQLMQVGYSKSRDGKYKLEGLGAHDDLAIACAGASFCAGPVAEEFECAWV